MASVDPGIEQVRQHDVAQGNAREDEVRHRHLFALEGEIAEAKASEEVRQVRPMRLETARYETTQGPSTSGPTATRETAARSEQRQRTAVTWPAWSPTQIVALVVAVAIIVVGGVALGRAGVTFSNVPAHRSMVIGLGFTSMSALITLVAGVVIAIGCVHPYSARFVSGGFGVVFLAFGLVVAVTPQPFFNMWNFTTANGVVIACLGVVLLLSTLVSPVFERSTSTLARHRSSVA